MSWDVDEKEFYETFAEIESERGIEEAKRWAWSALDWTQKELRKKEDGIEEERAAVVAWLRHGRWVEKCVYMRHEDGTGIPEAIHDAADTIERGEHLMEKG